MIIGGNDLRSNYTMLSDKHGHFIFQVAVYEAAHYRKRDEHTKCIVMFHASGQWLAFILNVSTLALAVVATFCCVILKDCES